MPALLAAVERRLQDLGRERGDLSVALRMLELAKSVPATWVAANPAKRRRILEVVGSNSMLADGTLCIKWRRPFDALVKRPSSAGWWAILDSNQ
ncbi:MAG: hypothetical protein ACRELB_05440 [Polyangiaceae bacterium]